MNTKPSAYVDLANLEEDQRIEIIGQAVLGKGLTVAVVTDDAPDDPGKADRYIAKVQARFHGVVVVSRHPGPVTGAVTIKFGPSN